MTTHRTYIDDDGTEYFVSRLVGGYFGVNCARKRLRSTPYICDVYRTHEQAQAALDSIAAEMDWRMK